MQIRFIHPTPAAWPGPVTMKTMLKRLSQTAGIIARTTLIAVLLGACTPGGGTSVSGAAPVKLGNYENAIKVTPTLDSERAVTRTIGFDGGSISATAADGTVFTLTVPADSVRQRTQVTMTPVSKLDGLPFGGGTEVTVDLQPSGLMFDVPATLHIEPATPIPAGEQILYGYSEDRLVLAEPVLKVEGIAIVVPHFSGYGVAKGFMGDVEEALKRIGGSAEERIYSEMRAILQLAQQAEQRGKPIQNLAALLDPFFEQLYREVVIPRLEVAGQSCAAGRAAAISLLSYLRQRELMGYDTGTTEKIEDFEHLLTLISIKCMDEEYAMCVNEHIVHRISIAYLATLRQFELFGIAPPPVLGKMKQQVNNCLHFDLEFKVDTRFELDTRSLNQSYMSYAESSELLTELAFNFDEISGSGQMYFEPSSGPMQSLKQVYRHKAPGCTQGTVSSWRDNGHFLAMDFDIDPPDLYTGGGGIKSIEVELGLPSPQVMISGMTCGGVTSPPMSDLVGAPALYLVNHGDGFIRDWKIQGEETPAGRSFVSATSEWSAMNGISAVASMEDKGIATLRHTPR